MLSSPASAASTQRNVGWSPTFGGGLDVLARSIHPGPWTLNRPDHASDVAGLWSQSGTPEGSPCRTGTRCGSGSAGAGRPDRAPARSQPRRAARARSRPPEHPSALGLRPAEVHGPDIVPARHRSRPASRRGGRQVVATTWYTVQHAPVAPTGSRTRRPVDPKDAGQPPAGSACTAGFPHQPPGQGGDATGDQATEVPPDGAPPRTRDWVLGLVVVLAAAVLVTAALAWVPVGSSSCGTRPAPGNMHSGSDCRSYVGLQPSAGPGPVDPQSAPGPGWDQGAMRYRRST